MHPLVAYLEADHDRLDRLLGEAERTPGAIDLEPFGAFRRGLLRHIGIEEKILFAAAKTARGGDPVPEFDRLRADHARLTALLVPTPTPDIVAKIRAVLVPHNEIEERDGGTYAVCLDALGADADALLERMREVAEPPVRPYYDARKPILLQDD